MSEEEVKKYAKLIMVMTTDYLMGSITHETYVANIEAISNKLSPGA